MSRVKAAKTKLAEQVATLEAQSAKAVAKDQDGLALEVTDNISLVATHCTQPR